MIELYLSKVTENSESEQAGKYYKLLAQSTGDFTRDELKKDVKLAWTDKTKAEIAAAKGTSGSETTESGGSGSNENQNQNGGGSQNGGTTGGGDNTGGDNSGGGNLGQN